ncbi:MAG: GntR family transcriptional regulator [Betaproteobacteria bacterium]
MNPMLTTVSITICDRIRDDIVAGSLAFGSRLTLDLLAERYSVGHMPIREALRHLQGEGLVVLTPNRGARVRVVDIEFVRNIFDLRISIEAMMARRAAEGIDKGQIARLEAIEAAYEERAQARDYAALLALNRQFHSVINEAANNPEAEAVIDRHRRLIAALWNLYGYGEDRPASVIADHRYIIGALASHDGDAAAALAMAHAAKAKMELISRMLAKERRGARAGVSLAA